MNQTSRVFGFQRLAGFAAILLVASYSAQQAAAQAFGDIRVEFTNEGNSDFFLTPLWFGFHDGTFDMFDAGSAASADLGTDSVERLAEDGMVDGLQTDFTFMNFDGVAADPAGFGSGAGQPPVVDPGNTGVGYVTPVHPSNYAYLSFASMVIPSNDSFIANDDPLAYQVFDSSGNIIGGSYTIQVFGNQIWDSGTELNDEMGAAFSALGGTSSDENGVVHLQVAGELDDFQGTMTAAGTTINDLIAPGELLATITITQVVPEPTSAALVGFGMLGLMAGVRRSR